MTLHDQSRRFAIAAAAAILLTSAGEAANLFVSSAGSDANTCALATPCRTLQRAVDVAAAGSNVIVLDTAGYGAGATLNITKSISIIAEGVTASLLPSAGSGVTINGAGIVVTLRGLALNGQGGGALHGVVIQNAAAVHIENCTFERFTQHGINHANNAAELFVIDTISRNNGQVGLVFAGNPTAKLTVDNSRFENNGLHGVALNQSEATITRTVASGNAGAGFNQTPGRMTVIDSIAANNGASGFLANGGEVTLESVVSRNNVLAGFQVASAAGSIGRISNSVFTGNAQGIANSATVLTRQNNVVSGNTNNVTGNALTPLAGL